MHVEPDHLVIACRDLAQGSAWCAERLGAEPVAGGRHAHMGTHNRLLSIASATAPRVYLELIAIDPEAPAPAAPRWFGLDEPALQAALEQGPRLVAWVGRSPQIDMHRWGLITLGVPQGRTFTAERAVPGAGPDVAPLRWLFVPTEDGRPPLGGAAPHLIQWQGAHPCERLPASPVALQRLLVRGLSARQAQVLSLRGVQREPAAADRAALAVQLDTPRGLVELEGHVWP